MDYSLKESSKYLEMPYKHLENYAKVGKELKFFRKGIRYVIDKTELDNWKALREFRTVHLDRDDYIECLEFALKSFYAYKSTADFGTATQRGAGKFVDNFTSGKLGEIAFKKFLKENFDIDTKLDFTLRDAIVGQDITEIANPRRGPKVFNPPRIRISIKTTKIRNVWLLVPQNELDDRERSSDAYILSRVELHPNHIFRFLKLDDSLKNLRDIIPDFEPLRAEVVGFAWKESLTANPPVKEIPGQEIQSSYALRSGNLKCTADDWNEFILKL